MESLSYVYDPPCPVETTYIWGMQSFERQWKACKWMNWVAWYVKVLELSTTLEPLKQTDIIGLEKQSPEKANEFSKLAEMFISQLQLRMHQYKSD